jgi:hypothetical protein
MSEIDDPDKEELRNQKLKRPLARGSASTARIWPTA